MALSTVAVTIANAASLSDAANVKGKRLVAIIMPAGWTTAAITLQASVDGTLYGSVFSAAGVEWTIASANVTPDKYIWLTTNGQSTDAPIYANNLKIRSGTKASAVTQGADRVLTLVLSG